MGYLSYTLYYNAQILKIKYVLDLRINKNATARYLLLSQYHLLDVFKLSLQPADLLAVQRHIQGA